MKHLDTGSDKIKKICDAIRHETLEPAKQQARVIVEQASDQAALILQDARNQADAMLDNAKKQHEKDKQIFEASMQHASKLFKEKLKIELEQHFLSQAIHKISSDLFHSSELSAQVVSALVEGYSNKALNGDFIAMISHHLDKEKFVKALSSEVKRKIAQVQHSNITSGVVLKSEGDNLRIDIDEKQLSDALMQVVRSDFRKYFYQGS